MKIGLDFDNTLVSYDRLFHQVALEQGHISPALPRSKLAVRDHLRDLGREPVWTALQGQVYGARLLEAEIFPGVVAFLTWTRRAGLDVAIVSHKTRHPVIGPPYDLHGQARRWVERFLSDAAGPLIPETRVHFEPTRAEKLGRIRDEAFDCFIDDLPEILTAPEFPAGTTPILFDPERRGHPQIVRCAGSWAEITALVEARWTRRPI